MKQKLLGLLVWVLLVVTSVTDDVFAQEINFGSFGNYGISISTVPGQDILDFEMVIVGTGVKTIELTDPGIAILEIEGVRYLDVFVTVDAPPFLELVGNPNPPDASTQLPLEIQFAYSNVGQSNNSVANSRLVTGNMARFGIVRRNSGPPGPPPTPPHANYTPPTDVAQIYIFGSVNAVTGLVAGQYENIITVTVDYEL